MAFLITDSAAPLLMETVPALKITHYYGHAVRDNVYAYLRCFVRSGSVYCCFTCFDEAPPETAFLALCLQPADRSETALCFAAGKGSGTVLTVRGADGTVLKTLAAQAADAVQVVTGGDEQGLYWSINAVLPATAFSEVFGDTPKSGSVFAGNLYLCNSAETAFGAAFPVPEGAGALSALGFGTFMVVPY